MIAPVVVDRTVGCIEKDGKKTTEIDTETRDTSELQQLQPSLSDTTDRDVGGTKELLSSETSFFQETTSLNGVSDVGAVVSKAKRAASSLWLLLHAQSCRLGGDRCQHTGCNDAKLILLHLKTCPAGSSFDCPQGFNGCNQSRKLLAHYRKCREVRQRQCGIRSSRRSPMAQHQVCLVCSLVARQARNVLDAAGTSNRSSSRKSTIVNKKVGSSFSSRQSAEGASTVVVPGMLHPEAPKEDMPPPPPRFPQASASVSIHKTKLLGSSEMRVCESPPSTTVLMRRELRAVATAASPQSTADDPSLLGKSVDSSMASFLGREATGTSPLPSLRRSRAESYDTAAASISLSASTEFDPTIESDLAIEAATSGRKSKFGERGRSASTGMLSALQSCDTIEEEAPFPGYEEHQFLLEEDTYY